jgi:hypothetical protein
MAWTMQMLAFARVRASEWVTPRSMSPMVVNMASSHFEAYGEPMLNYVCNMLPPISPVRMMAVE